MPQRNTDNVRPEHTRSLQCQLCQCVTLHTDGEKGLDDGNLQYFLDRFFHETCTTCPPTELSLEPLCSFCSHLRLPHIFGCVTPEIEILPLPSQITEFSTQWVKGTPEIEILPLPSQITGFSTQWVKGYTALLEDQACPLCALIGSILRKRTTKIDQDDGETFCDSVSVSFWSERDRYRKLGPWSLSISLSSSDMRKYKGFTWVGEMNVAKDSSGKATYSEPLLGPDLNWDLVRQWVGKCHRDHPSQKIPIDSTDEHFRLIDVRNSRLVDASKSWTYAALSYVWGDVGAGEAQAVKANVSQLEEKGLLLLKLPQCILDALTVCRELGVNFLWVDRLCIVQDDSHSKHGQIKQMGSIYASAIVTIVAAAGENAGHGLVGVSRLSASAQHRQKLALQGIEFSEKLQAQDFSESVQQSVWRSRGWTFQEEKLSTALLLFSERGVSFQCKHRPDEMEMEGLTESKLPENPNSSYPSVVSEYSQRKLSFGSDILDAFSGYLGMEFKDQHYFGLPCAYFTQALLWKSADDSGLPRKGNGNETFPSWSWASITGAVNYQSWFMPGNHEHVASWAAILFPPGSKSPQLLSVYEAPSKLPKLQELLRVELSWQSPWRKYLLKQRLLSPILHEELIRFWTTLQRQVKSDKGFWFQNRWFSNVITGLMPREVFQAGRLLAYTQIANVSVTRLLWPTSFALGRSAPFVLRNKWGKWIGFVNPDKPTAERIDSYSLRGKTYSAECLALSLHRGEDSTVPLLLDEDLDTIQDRAEQPSEDIQSQYIFKRRSNRFWREMGCLTHQVSEAVRQYRPFLLRGIDEPHSGYPPQLTVMMVERTEGVARRVGVGNVYLKRWRESAPSFQSVILD